MAPPVVVGGADDLVDLREHGRSRTPLRYVLNNAVGFGGINACVVMGKFDAA